VLAGFRHVFCYGFQELGSLKQRNIHNAHRNADQNSQQCTKLEMLSEDFDSWMIYTTPPSAAQFEDLHYATISISDCAEGQVC
jgi:hypothetical protein